MHNLISCTHFVLGPIFSIQIHFSCKLSTVNSNILHVIRKLRDQYRIKAFAYISFEKYLLEDNYSTMFSKTTCVCTQLRPDRLCYLASLHSKSCVRTNRNFNLQKIKKYKYMKKSMKMFYNLPN